MQRKKGKLGIDKIDAYNAMMGKTYNKVTPKGSDSDGDKKPTTPTGKFKGIEDDLVDKVPKQIKNVELQKKQYRWV